MNARSGIVMAARAWKVMLEVPEIKMASSGAGLWLAGWFLRR